MIEYEINDSNNSNLCAISVCPICGETYSHSYETQGFDLFDDGTGRFSEDRKCEICEKVFRVDHYFKFVITRSNCCE